jgi:hypothetical protein
MTSRKPTFRPGLRDQQRAIKATMEGMARLHGVTLPDGALSDVKDKIARGPRTVKDTKPESEVQSESIDYLVRHPAVALVIRVNSGAVHTQGGGFVQFHHVYMPHRFRTAGKIERVKMRVSDLWCVLTDGKICVIECKRGDWVKPCNEREIEQQNFITHICNNGGIGFFANSVDVVRKNLILNGY